MKMSGLHAGCQQRSLSELGSKSGSTFRVSGEKIPSRKSKFSYYVRCAGNKNEKSANKPKIKWIAQICSCALSDDFQMFPFKTSNIRNGKAGEPQPTLKCSSTCKGSSVIWRRQM